MKTTLELPDRVLHELERRATSQGRDVNDLVTDILTADIAPTTPDDTRLRRRLYHGSRFGRSSRWPIALTTQEWCDWIKEVDSQLEVERYEKALGHQHVDRSDG